MVSPEINDFLKAGKITSIAREFAKKKIAKGVNIYEYVKSIEKKIESSGGKLAFPVNVSINEFAAHDTAKYLGPEEFSESQVVKVDIGASVNGYLGDTAFTAEIGSSKYSKLISASNEALNNAIEIIKPGIKHCEIGRIIHKTIKSHGFNPIFNLGGHGLSKFNLHANIFIPNYDNGDSNKFFSGQMIALEPFATNGAGRVSDTSVSKIYSLDKKKPVRMDSTRKVLKYIDENFNSLPFADYHLLIKFTPSQVSIALKEMLRLGILHSYPQLKEVSGGIVSQTEHSLLINENGAVVSTE
ncbi:MAG: type II methionyl aminopeptidase [Candidatus Nanoarchaeia archaeon]|nr:type II methionyl aminopeptidase [Candidatus Nanoarchaeia archaeon]